MGFGGRLDLKYVVRVEKTGFGISEFKRLGLESQRDRDEVEKAPSKKIWALVRVLTQPVGGTSWSPLNLLYSRLCTPPSCSKADGSQNQDYNPCVLKSRLGQLLLLEIISF